jgi:hypothetical protein
VVRAALHMIDQQHWDHVAALVDPVALKVFRDRRLEEARLDEERARESEQENLVSDPDFAFSIQDYFLQADTHQTHRDSGELRHTTGTSLAELEHMTAAQLLGVALRARDPRGALPDESSNADATPAVKLHPRRVIGEVISGDAAYVLYTSQWSEPRGVTNVIVLRRARGGWAMLPHGELFGHDAAAAAQAVAGSALPVLQPLPVRQAAWTSRSFRHQVTVDLFPSVLERFRGTPARLSELTAAAPAEWRTAQPEGKWSVQEHVGHLLDLELLGEQRLNDFRERAATLAAADMTNRKTAEARHNDVDLADLLQRFRAAREHLVARIASLTPDILIHSARHPRLDRYMNVTDWIFFMCEHDDHHLARIREQLTDLSIAGRSGRPLT